MRRPADDSATTGAAGSPALDALLADLDRLLQERSTQGREKTFKQVVELYFASVAIHREEHSAFFGDVFALLVDHVGTDDLAELGKRIAPIAQAPARLVRRLANDDDIAVAAPVIARSARLTTDDLVMLAQTKGQAHLRAIGGRDSVEAAVTSVLVARGDADVLKRVSMNAGAEFSDDGFAQLAQKALREDDLAEIVGTRSDIPGRVLRALASQASEAVRARMLAKAGPDMKTEIASAIAARGADKVGLGAERPGSPRSHGDAVSEAEIVDLARRGRIDEIVAALALRCAIPGDVVRRLMTTVPVEALPVMGKAGGLSWTATDAVIGLCRLAGRPLGAADRRRALENFAKLTKPVSEKLLRFWFVRGSKRAERRSGDERGNEAAERRRRKDRRPVELMAAVFVDDRQIADVMVEDLSMEGAKLRLLSAADLPDRFVLSLWANSRISRRCLVRWRSRSHIGVEFV